jgi:hypothetical protein
MRRTEQNWAGMTFQQGGQIGRIVAHWAIVFLAHFLKLQK